MPGVFKGVGMFPWDKNGVSGSDVSDLGSDSHPPRARKNVINLLCFEVKVPAYD